MIHARSDYNRIQDPEGKIGEDEPVILFRAQDKLFLGVLYSYRSDLTGDGFRDDHPMVRAIDAHIERTYEWGKTHTTKTPDMPDDAVYDL